MSTPAGQDPADQDPADEPDEDQDDEQEPAGPTLRERYANASNNRVSRWMASRPPNRTPRQAREHAIASGLLGLMAYAMFINGIRYGTPGVTGWLKAKFLNKPMQGFSVVAPNQPIVQQPTAPVSA